MTGQESQRRSDVAMGQDQVAPVCFVTWHLERSSALIETHCQSAQLTGTMSSLQRPDCACRCQVHTRHTGLWCGTLDKTPAAIIQALVTHSTHETLKVTVDASMLPPNHTAYLCIWCWITETSIGFGCKITKLKWILKFLQSAHLLSRQLFRCIEPRIHKLLDVPLQPLSKVLTQRISCQQHTTNRSQKLLP